MKRKRAIAVLAVTVGLTATTAWANLTTGLIAYYPFNGNANDESGNNHHGAVSGATLTSDRFGNVDSAYNFDGNDRIDVPDHADFTLGANPFTIAAWMQYDPVSSYYLMGHDEGPGERNKWILWVHSSGFHLHVNGPSFSGYSAVAYGGMTPEAERWYHMVVRRDGTLYTLFLDGSPVASRTESRAIPNPNTTFQMGTAESGHPERVFRGVLDDVRWYNRALSDDEIQDLYDWEPTIIPVPGALAVATLGTCLVGWLRRRGSI